MCSAGTLELLVATQDGVLRTDTNGLISPECVDGTPGVSGECWVTVHVSYRIAGYFRMLQIFVFFVCEVCIQK